MKRVAVLWLLCLGCAGAAPVAKVPEGPAVTPAPAPVVSDSKPKAKPVEPAAVPKPPERCDAFLVQVKCANTGTAAEELAAALELEPPDARDRGLACLEGHWPQGAPLVRLLRAELAPAECSDVVVTPYLESPPRKLDAVEESALLGFLISARLTRLVGAAPVLAPPFDKPRFTAYFEEQLKPWLIGQALAIGELSQQAAKLTGYGKAVAALAAGQADLRFVRAARAVPLPTELASDPELKNTYDAALDEALEPRKARGRDAALVGLRTLAELGAARDGRIDAARSVLSELYGGRRIDALDRLLLPELPPLTPSSVEERLALRLPTFYAGRLLAKAANLKTAGVLQALGERGIPSNTFAILDLGGLSRDAVLYYAVAEVRRGITHFAAPAFVHAQALLGEKPSGDAERLLSALAAALSAAPRDAAELMLSGPRLPAPLGNLEPLEALARQNGPLSGLAEFDAAYLRSLTPTENDPAFWTDLAARYARSEKKLKRSEQRALAHELSEAARATAKALKR
jgi:hypothetical protein